MSTTTVPRFELSHRMARALEVSGVDVTEMASILGVHENTVHNYITGRRRPKRGMVAAWAARTGVPQEWLEHGDDSPDTDPDDGGITPRYSAKTAHGDRRDRLRPRNRQPLGGGLRRAA